MNIGTRLAILSKLHCDRVLGRGRDTVAHMGFKGQALLLIPMLHCEIDRYKWRILHSDPDLFNGGH